MLDFTSTWDPRQRLYNFFGVFICWKCLYWSASSPVTIPEPFSQSHFSFFVLCMRLRSKLGSSNDAGVILLYSAPDLLCFGLYYAIINCLLLLWENGHLWIRGWYLSILNYTCWRAVPSFHVTLLTLWDSSMSSLRGLSERSKDLWSYPSTW